MGLTTHLGLHSQATRLFDNNLVAQQGPAVDGALTLFGVPFQGTCTRPAAEVESQDYNSGGGQAPGFSVWAIPGSLAATKGILVGFSSSA
jgi:hypothetical protein